MVQSDVVRDSGHHEVRPVTGRVPFCADSRPQIEPPNDRKLTKQSAFARNPVFGHDGLVDLDCFLHQRPAY
ncbi:MAG: hypothetical protein ACI9F9_003389 [Candidatus Paceibacteria bacterium]|jgi:hypothetical protein